MKRGGRGSAKRWIVEQMEEDEELGCRRSFAGERRAALGDPRWNTATAVVEGWKAEGGSVEFRRPCRSRCSRGGLTESSRKTTMVVGGGVVGESRRRRRRRMMAKLRSPEMAKWCLVDGGDVLAGGEEGGGLRIRYGEWRGYAVGGWKLICDGLITIGKDGRGNGWLLMKGMGIPLSVG